MVLTANNSYGRSRRNSVVRFLSQCAFSVCSHGLSILGSQENSFQRYCVLVTQECTDGIPGGCFSNTHCCSRLVDIVDCHRFVEPREHETVVEFVV